MAKKQTKGKAKASGKKLDIKKFWHAHWVGILVVVLVSGVFAFIGINKLIVRNQINAQKAQFDAAEANLDDLYADIVKEVGQPTSVEKDKSCSYRSAKLYQGERHCDVNISLYFDSIKGKDEARDFSLKAEKVITESNKFIDFRKNANYIDPYISIDAYNGSTDFKMASTSMTCWASYEIDPSGNRSPAKYRLSLSCGNVAKSEFYPVKN